MILHSLACHCIVSYGVAWYCIVGFGAGCISQDTYLLYEFILNVLHSFPDEVELLQTWKWPEKTPLTNLCGYGARTNKHGDMLSFACSVFAWGGVSLIECKMRSLELSSLVHSICMQLHRLIAISLSLSLSTQHNNFVTKSVLLRFTCFLGVPFSAIHCDDLLFHD